MATISENLNKVLQAKNNIKQAIIDKGVDMTDASFEDYSTKIGEIQGGDGGNANVTYESARYWYKDWDKYDEQDAVITYNGNEYLTYYNNYYYQATIPPKRILFEENSEDARNKLVCLTSDGNNYKYHLGGSGTSSYHYATPSVVVTLSDTDMTKLGYLFYNEATITEIVNMPSTVNTTNLYHMFDGCINLTSIPTKFINTSNAYNISYMFNGCASVTELDLSEWDVSKITDMNKLFYGCQLLTTIDLSKWNLSDGIKNYDYVFTDTPLLESVYLYACNDKTYKLIKQLLYDRPNLLLLGTPTGNNRLSDEESIVASGYDNLTVKFYQDEYSNPRYEGTNWYTTNEDNYELISTDRGGALRDNNILSMTVTNTSRYYINGSYYSYYSNNDDKEINTDTTTYLKSTSDGDFFYSATYGGYVTAINKFPCFKNCANLKNLFSKCTNVTKIEPFAITSTTTDISRMFYNCPALETVNCSYFDWSSITTVQKMFENCQKLKEIDMSYCNLSSDVTTTDMFYNCSVLTTIYMLYATEEAYNLINSVKREGCTIVYYAPTDEYRVPDDAEEVEIKVGKYMLTVKYKEQKYIDTIFDGEDEWRPSDEYEVITSVEIPSYVNIDLNDQWQPLTYESNALEDYTVYESFSNYNVNSGRAKMKIAFFGYPSFTFKYRSDGESGFDYVIVSKLDTELGSSDAYNSSTVQYYTKGSQGSWFDAVYANDGEEHFIEIVYLKDGSSNTEPDKGFIAIPNEYL